MSRNKDIDYDTPEKALYRLQVWTSSEKCVSKPVSQQRVAILDTSQALESIFLLSRRYKGSNILAICESAAKCASLTKKLKRLNLPPVVTSSGSVNGEERGWTEALFQAVKDGWKFDVLHFDSTQIVGPDLVATLLGSLRLTKPKALIVNMQAGRESKHSGIDFGSESMIRTSANREVRDVHRARILGLFHYLLFNDHGHLQRRLYSPGLTKFFWGKYTAQRTPMVWGVAGLDWNATSYLSGYEQKLIEEFPPANAVRRALFGSAEALLIPESKRKRMTAAEQQEAGVKAMLEEKKSLGIDARSITLADLIGRRKR